jgi:hypothetical protein
MALSAYMSELQSYNVIDKDYINGNENEEKVSEYEMSSDNKSELKSNNVIIPNLTLV